MDANIYPIRAAPPRNPRKRDRNLNGTAPAVQEPYFTDIAGAVMMLKFGTAIPHIATI